jgi:thioredoxin-related protein
MKNLVSALFITGILLVASFSSKAQVGKMFPALSGETLDGTAITMPDKAKGKYTIIGMAHSSDAEQDLQTWMDPIYQKYIAKTGLLDGAEDVNVYFIPMFSGSSMPFYDKSKKQMKETTQKDLQPHVIFYKGEITSYKEQLLIDKKDTPYIFLLDTTGKIIYATSGNWTEAKMDAIDEKIQ